MWVHQPTLFLGFGAPLWIDAQEAPVNKTRKQLSVLHIYILHTFFQRQMQYTLHQRRHRHSDIINN